MSAPRVAIRVDASAAIGSGHLMRCLALADELRARGAATRFVCRHLPDGLAARLAASGHGVARLPAGPPARPPDLDLAHATWLGVSQADDAAATLAALSDAPAWDWLVVDHYGLDARFERPLRRVVRKILAVDDLADRPHDADALLDPGRLGEADAARYAPLLPPSCRRLLGPSYAILRREFREARGERRAPSTAPRVNVTFGGIDAGGTTLRALRALEIAGIDGLLADVVIGGANPHRAAIADLCARLPGTTLHVDTPEMAGLFRRADLALGAGGVTSWERCCVGLPSIVASIAENQRGVCRALAAARAAIDVGDMDRVSPGALADLLRRVISRPSLLARIGRRAAALVDGRGAERVALFLLRGPLALRRATTGDARLAWSWRNDPVTRRFSLDSAPVPWETHERWWAKAAASPSRVLLVVSCAGSEVGVLRFDLAGEEAVVSIYLDPALNGLGLGSVVLREGTAWVRANLPVKVIRAVILPENGPSIRSFKAAGYVPAANGNEREWTLAVQHGPREAR
jgi:UDP-2,4-diacetamido-2,4,6-trideoxy-beta-L-altropyranose hydrolase